jgi:uncharacterized heparinase superfamily protein
MNTVEPTMPADSIFLMPWAAMDDAALLTHFRGPRGVHYFPVADEEETKPETIDALLAGCFSFNGEAHTLPDPIDWLHNPSRDVEWHILLHKFYYAVGLGLAFQRSGDARYVQRWVTLIDTWMQATPPGFIAADVTGRRVQNWIYSLHLLVGHAAHDTLAHVPPAFHARMLRSLHEQVEYLCANLTDKRNHRTLELYAIFLAGVVFPEMRRAAHWRDFALAQTVDNLRSDLLPDGVHCELSTDYHHLVLKNALNFRRLATMNHIPVPPAFDQPLERGLTFSMHVHNPLGVVPSLSDGDARSYLDLLRQGAELFHRADMLFVATQGTQGTAPAQRVAHFPDSGYSTVRSGWGHGATAFKQAQHLVFDCGPLGEGNHGHFDCLSFELAAFGRSLIVDPGRYTYSESVNASDGINWRVRFRGTAAHNTVCVDGLQQTRYEPKAIKPGTRHTSGTVRHKISGPAPDAALLDHHQCDTLDLLHGQARSHAYDAVHDRCIVFVDQRYWIVSDWLRASTRHHYTLNFQLSAQAQGNTTVSSGADLRLQSPGLLMLQPVRPGVHAALHDSWVSARYGDKQAAPTFQSVVTFADANFDTVLVPWQGQEPAISVADVPVEGIGAGTPATALRIALTVDGQPVIDHWFHTHGPASQSWCLDGHAFHGRWAHWRTDTQGHLIRAVSHGGATLPPLCTLEPTS